MIYDMTVIIYDPKTPEGRSSDLVLKMKAAFTYNPETYGNGHYVKITGGEGFCNIYDLRYDKTFHRNEKEDWLKAWANSYWSGEDGAYAVKKLTIKEA